jgi:hypothetical protein
VVLRTYVQEKEQDTTRIQIHMTRLKETTCTDDAEMMLIEMLTPHEQENPSSDPMNKYI